MSTPYDRRKEIPKRDITPGLNVCIDFKGNGNFYERGKVIKKLRKNWLVNIPKRDLSYIGGINGNYSIPRNRLKVDFGFTKDGRALLATKEDNKIFWSKEHVDYCMSFDWDFCNREEKQFYDNRQSN